MNRIVDEAKRIESGMYFNTGGGEYMKMTMRRLIRSAVDQWLQGDASAAELNEALACWEDMTGKRPSVVRLCDDLRYVQTLDDWQEREGFMRAIWPRLREGLATLEPPHRDST